MDGSSQIENLRMKVWRHIRGGDLKPGTLGRGAKQLLDHLNTPNLADAQISLIATQENYAGRRDLRVTQYSLTPDPASLAWHRRGHALKDRTATVVDFPTGSQLMVRVLPKDERRKSYRSEHVLRRDNSAIAAFTGPTHSKRSSK